MRKPTIILVFLGITILINVISFFIFQNHQKKIAVIDVIELFNEYNMKKDLLKESDKQLNVVIQYVDSLKKQLTIESKNPNSKQNLDALFEQYSNAQKQLDREYNIINESINEQVWKRLNPLIDEYCKEKDINLMLGANGMGSILYKNDVHDNTEEVIKYVNAKYEGKN